MADPNYVAKIEQAISEKYGEDTIQNPKGNWDENKEKEQLKQMNAFYAKTHKNDEWQEKVDINGIKISKKLFNRDSVRNCPVCGSFAKKSLDDIYIIKYECCNTCYVKHVEGREERWKGGWRPTVQQPQEEQS